MSICSSNLALPGHYDIIPVKHKSQLALVVTPKGSLQYWMLNMTKQIYQSLLETIVLTYSHLTERSCSHCCSNTRCSLMVQWSLAKKMSAYKFNSYVVSTERETKNLQPELSHRIHSRARQLVKSPIKAPRQWCPSQLLLRVHFLKRHQPKMCDRLRTHYPIDLAL